MDIGHNPSRRERSPGRRCSSVRPRPPPPPHPCHLVAGDVRETGEPLVAHPGVPVAAAHPGGLDPEQHPILRKLGVGHIGDLEWLAKSGDQRRASVTPRRRVHYSSSNAIPPVGMSRNGPRLRRAANPGLGSTGAVAANPGLGGCGYPGIGAFERGDHARPTSRRLFLADLGKGGVAVLVLGLVACSDTVEAATSPPVADLPPAQTRLLRRRPSPGTRAPETTRPTSGRPISSGVRSRSVLSRPTSWHARVRRRLSIPACRQRPRYRSGPRRDRAWLGCRGACHPDPQARRPRGERHRGARVGRFRHRVRRRRRHRVDHCSPATHTGGRRRPRLRPRDHRHPGHTPGHVCVLDSTIGLLVAGDALSVQGGVVAGPNVSFTEDLTQAHESVRKLAGFQFGVLVVGHGDPIETNASQQVAEFAADL